MSHAASIYINYDAHHRLSVSEIIRMYISNGWNLDDFGHISLRPLGDKDDFKWVVLELGQVEQLFEIIRKKVESDENPAVVLTLDNTQIGATTTFFPKEERIWFHLLINTQRHPLLPEWTDISWYLPQILKPLLTNGVGVYQIESFEAL